MKTTILFPDIIFGQCPACHLGSPKPTPNPHTSKFEDTSTFYCRTGNRQVRRTSISELPIDPIAHTQHVAEIRGEVLATAGETMVTLLSLREILRIVSGDRALIEAINLLVETS